MSCFKKHLNLSSFLLVLTVSLVMINGCSAPSHRVHPQFDTRFNTITKPVLITADVKVFESLPGGMVLLRDDWGKLGRQNLQNAIVEGFREKNCRVKLLDHNAELKTELEEIRSLYNVVNKSIRLQSYIHASASKPPSDFDYSIGSLEHILPKLGGDAAIFVSALEKVFNGKSLAVVNLAIADPSGTIIWYAEEGSRGKSGFTHTTAAMALVKRLIFSFPEVDG